MGLSPLRREPLVETAVTHLRAQLSADTWPVGTKLPAETELAAALRVGRSTVREAVRVLVHTGLLETRQGSGTYVRATSSVEPWEARLRRAEILEVYEVRQTMESRAAALAAQRRADEDLERIEQTLESRHELRAKGRGPQVDPLFVEADLAFHRAVVDAAHNTLLAELYASFTDALREALSKITADPDMETFDVSDAHTELAAAIRAGDAAAAERATRANLDVTTSALRRLLRD